MIWTLMKQSSLKCNGPKSLHFDEKDEDDVDNPTQPLCDNKNSIIVANSYPDIRVETGYENGTGTQASVMEENHVRHRAGGCSPPQNVERQTSSSSQLHFETGL